MSGLEDYTHLTRLPENYIRKCCICGKPIKKRAFICQECYENPDYQCWRI